MGLEGSGAAGGDLGGTEYGQQGWHFSCIIGKSIANRKTFRYAAHTQGPCLVAPSRAGRTSKSTMRWSFKRLAAAGTVPAPPREIRQATMSHIVPYVAWVAIMILLDIPGLPTAWRYAMQTAVCAGLFLVLRPWRWYTPLKMQNLFLALVVGVLVYVVWVGPESAWMKSRNPVFYDFYQKMFAVQPWVEAPKPPKIWPYAPEVCGWPLSLVRLGGSALVIAVIEEFFFRGFIYRWMVSENFVRLDIGYFHPAIFFLMNGAFGFEHSQWLVGIFAGLAFGFVMIFTRDIWAAALSHGVTNFLLGIYVLETGNYHFW